MKLWEKKAPGWGELWWVRECHIAIKNKSGERQQLKVIESMIQHETKTREQCVKVLIKLRTRYVNKLFQFGSYLSLLTFCLVLFVSLIWTVYAHIWHYLLSNYSRRNWAIGVGRVGSGAPTGGRTLEQGGTLPLISTGRSTLNYCQQQNLIIRWHLVAVGVMT